jgi:4-hydroxy-tetrahydrodipicolinate synthase
MVELRGIFSVLCTPFTEDEELDLESLDRLVEFTIASGVHALAVGGSASELPLLTPEERKTIAERVIAKVDGRLPVLVGISHESWFHACNMLMHAAALKAAGFVVVPPRAGAPSEERIRRFFRDLGECAEGLPVILQNSPGFTGVTLSTELLLRIAQDAGNLGFVKLESQPTGPRTSRLVRESAGAIKVFGGLGGRYLLEELPRGAQGCFVGPAFPEVAVGMWRAHAGGDVAAAKRLYRAHASLLELVYQSTDWAIQSHKLLLHEGGILASPTVRRPSTLFETLSRELLLELASDLDLQVLRA